LKILFFFRQKCIFHQTAAEMLFVLFNLNFNSGVMENMQKVHLSHFYINKNALNTKASTAALLYFKKRQTAEYSTVYIFAETATLPTVENGII
jgi:hypothetical protein